MDEPLISIIVPIYNVEKYLNRCIESIVNQTYKNLEIILVDDGSPDNCPQICDEWKKKNNRIKVIHKKNGGLSDARNAGLDIAQGEYIAFVDSDDWILPNMYQKLMKVMKDTNSDIVQCNYERVLDDDCREIMNNNNPKVISFDAHDALKNLIEENNLNQMVWNKLFKKELFENLLFEVGMLNEDDFITYQLFSKANKISYVDSKEYCYLIRNTSIMGESYSIKRLDGLEARYRQYNFYKKNYIDLAVICKKSLIFYLVYCLQKTYSIKNKKEKKNATLIIKDYFKVLKKDKIEMELNFKEKIWFILMKISLKITAKLRNYLKINV